MRQRRGSVPLDSAWATWTKDIETRIRLTGSYHLLRRWSQTDATAASRHADTAQGLGGQEKKFTKAVWKTQKTKNESKTWMVNLNGHSKVTNGFQNFLISSVQGLPGFLSGRLFDLEPPEVGPLQEQLLLHESVKNSILKSVFNVTCSQVHSSNTCQLKHWVLKSKKMNLATLIK